MARAGEHVHRDDGLEGIGGAEFLELFAEFEGVAGDVDEAGRAAGDQGIQEFVGEAVARRVKDHAG